MEFFGCPLWSKLRLVPRAYLETSLKQKPDPARGRKYVGVSPPKAQGGGFGVYCSRNIFFKQRYFSPTLT